MVVMVGWLGERASCRVMNGPEGGPVDVEGAGGWPQDTACLPPILKIQYSTVHGFYLWIETATPTARTASSALSLTGIYNLLAGRALKLD